MPWNYSIDCNNIRNFSAWIQAPLKAESNRTKPFKPMNLSHCVAKRSQAYIRATAIRLIDTNIFMLLGIPTKKCWSSHVWQTLSVECKIWSHFAHGSRSTCSFKYSSSRKNVVWLDWTWPTQLNLEFKLVEMVYAYIRKEYWFCTGLSSELYLKLNCRWCRWKQRRGCSQLFRFDNFELLL